MGNVGIIALAYGQQGGREYPLAGPSNKKITNLAWRIFTTENRAGNGPMISAQWETCIGLPPTYISLLTNQYGSDATPYVDTKTVLDKSFAFFREHGVTRVILVGHPIHLFFINLLVESGIWKVDGIKIDHQYDRLMKSVPYDRSPGNVQWWTRNPVAFVFYLVKALVTNKHGG